MKSILISIIGCCCLLQAQAQRVKDSIAIVQLLQKEAATWRSGDVESHAACWHIQPYSRILISLPDGKVLDVPPAFMVQPAQGSMGGGGTFTISDFKMSIYSKSAWVSHREESVSKDGVTSYSYEIRMLEKINGQWKLIGQSIHMYKP